MCKIFPRLLSALDSWLSDRSISIMMADIAPMRVGNNPNHRRVRRPLFPEIGVVAFVPEKWGGPWLSRHQVLTRLSKYFHVLWAEPAQSWRELVLGGGKTVDGSSSSLEVFPEGFALYQPERWLPQFGRPAWEPPGLRRNEVAEQQHCFVNKGARP